MFAEYLKLDTHGKNQQNNENQRKRNRKEEHTNKKRIARLKFFLQLTELTEKNFVHELHPVF